MAAQDHNLFHHLFTAFYTLVRSVFESFLWIVVGVGGLVILETRKPPLDIILGLPLLIAGGGLTVNKLWSVVLVFFYPTYNRGICPLCEKSF